MGGGFYDNPATLGRYLEHRHGGTSSPNLMMEEPALKQALGPVDGLRIVDLGCGDAAIAASLMASGASSYLGIDASGSMVAAASRSLAGVAAARIEQAAIEDVALAASSADVIISRLALHYVADLETVLETCAQGLVTGGRLVFSVVHPVITSHDAAHIPGQARTSWLVDGYFDTGPRLREWLGASVTWQHRTVEDYLTAVLRAGFTVTGLSECGPVRALFGDDEAEFERRRRVPLFLLVAAHR